MHLIIKNNNRYVWVEILSCTSVAEIEAVFISDNNKPVRFKPKNGIIPYNGNGLYNFMVTCGSEKSNISRYIGNTAPKVFTKHKKDSSESKKVALRSKAKPAQVNYEKLNLSVLTPDQLKELEHIVTTQDLSAAMRLYRATDIGSREYCCANMEVLKNMGSALKEHKDGELAV
jgi:hypothetical protein